MRSRTLALVEALEKRMHLSATLKVAGTTLSITGDNGNQIVQIMDDHLPPDRVATVVRIDADGNGSFDDPGDISGQTFTGIEHFAVKLGAGDDDLDFHLDAYFSVKKTLNADLGNGNNTFSFGFGLSQSLSSSKLTVRLRSGNGNDKATVGLNDLKNSSVLDIRMHLGRGDDTLATNFFGDVADGSMLRLDADLGQGNDTFHSNVDYESFDIFGPSRAILDIDGGSGSDTFAITAGNPEMGDTAHTDGEWGINLKGGSGDDTITVDLPSADFAGSVYLHEVGGSGKDTHSMPRSSHRRAAIHA